MENYTTDSPQEEAVQDTDATWILTSVFIIFTMQSGFGLLESGVVSKKNKANIMMKNAADVIFGGITYYLFGYGLSYGSPGHNNPFCGEDNFAPQRDGKGSGTFYAHYIFQLSFATTATTIVSGGMAERVDLTAYIIFSSLNTFIYCIPAHWMWGENGWLATFGAIDFAGSGVVHLTGGTSALIGSILLGPRKGRYDKGTGPAQLDNPNQSMLGMFMLWWGWIGFNCGSTFGIVEGRWILAAKQVQLLRHIVPRAAVNTVNAAIAGGALAMTYSYLVRKRVYSVSDLMNGILGAMVGITSGCAIVQPWESFIIGSVGAIVTILTVPILDRLKIDDPIGAFAVHGTAGIWGLLSVGIFADVNPASDVTGGQRGLLHGGDGRLLLNQVVAAAAITIWSAVVSFALLLAIRATIGLRQSESEEELGADYAEHDIIPPGGIPYREDGSPAVRREWACRCCFRHRAKEAIELKDQEDASLPSSRKKRGKIDLMFQNNQAVPL